MNSHDLHLRLTTGILSKVHPHRFSAECAPLGMGSCREACSAASGAGKAVREHRSLYLECGAFRRFQPLGPARFLRRFVPRRRLKAAGCAALYRDSSQYNLGVDLRDFFRRKGGNYSPQGGA